MFIWTAALVCFSYLLCENIWKQPWPCSLYFKYLCWHLLSKIWQNRLKCWLFVLFIASRGRHNSKKRVDLFCLSNSIAIICWNEFIISHVILGCCVSFGWRPFWIIRIFLVFFLNTPFCCWHTQRVGDVMLVFLQLLILKSLKQLPCEAADGSVSAVGLHSDQWSWYFCASACLYYCVLHNWHHWVLKEQHVFHKVESHSGFPRKAIFVRRPCSCLRQSSWCFFLLNERLCWWSSL